VIVADTNVLSEPLRPRPDPGVMAWLSEHGDDLALTTITVGELLYGARCLDEGRRRDGLLAAIEALIAGAASRVLPYDEDAARHYARLRRSREAAGRVVGVEDTMIAAICLAGGHALATRNTGDFDLAGLQVVNPWSA
jgi:predicted nucleic acid-binding protein